MNINRRKFTEKILCAMCALLIITIEPEAGPRRRRVRRRVRRRTRRRVRRHIRWRVINGTRFVVIPVNIEAGDELIMGDGSVATITKVTEKNITITVDKKERTLPAIYEGSVDEKDT